MAGNLARCSGSLLLGYSLVVMNVVLAAILVFNLHLQYTCECGFNPPSRVPRGDITGLGNVTYCSRIATEVVILKQRTQEFMDIIKAMDKALSSSCYENESNVTSVYRFLLHGVHRCVEDAMPLLDDILESEKPKQRRRPPLEDY